MQKIGLITFHAAYNFGSSLQAYATQKTIQSLGYDVDIINYRLPNQIHYYGDLLTVRFGRKEFIRRALCCLELRARKKRANRYETFISSKLKLTDKTYHNIDELRNEKFAYSVIVAGSDQVWNEHCTAEFKTEPPSSILGYFLDFGEKDIKRISFSSSIGFMTEDEISRYIPQLNRFSHIALREQDGAEIIIKLLHKEVANTVDPTMLLNRKEWLEDFGSEMQTEDKDYILIYSLEKSPKKLRNIQEQVKIFAGGRNIICLAPFLPTHSPGITMRSDAGPIEFLSLLSNADCMITDSFHGTAFSVNLGIPFYTINTGRDQRKKLLLERVGLECQLIETANKLNGKKIPELDFSIAWHKMEEIRTESIEYLRMALNE